VFVFGMSHMRGVYDLAIGCVNGIAHRDLRTCAVSFFFTHKCAYSFGGNSIGAEGAQHIAAALAHNSTLQTLK
jgi:hypothetical protein